MVQVVGETTRSIVRSFGYPAIGRLPLSWKWSRIESTGCHLGPMKLSYTARLDRLRLFSFARSRLSSDLIEVFMIVRGTDKVIALSTFPRVVESNPRVHTFMDGGDMFNWGNRAVQSVSGTSCLKC